MRISIVTLLLASFLTAGCAHPERFWDFVNALGADVGTEGNVFAQPDPDGRQGDADGGGGNTAAGTGTGSSPGTGGTSSGSGGGSGAGGSPGLSG